MSEIWKEIPPPGSGSGGGLDGVGTIDSQPASLDGLTLDNNILYAQSATSAAPGMVNASAQAFAGLKTFRNGISLGLTSNTPFTVTHTASSGATATYALRWPVATGTANQLLQTDGNGNLKWVTSNVASTGISIIGTIDSETPSSDGAVIATNSLVMQSASTAVPGLVNNGTQGFHGAKSFNSLVTGAAGFNFKNGTAGFGNTVIASTALAGNYGLTWPVAQGTAGQVLRNTDGSGNLGWVTPFASGDVPAANLATTGNNGVTGTLPYLNGGTASTAFVEDFNGYIETPSNKTYTLIQNSFYPRRVDTVAVQATTGIGTLNFQIATSSITGLSAININSAAQTVVSTSANTLRAGDKLTMILTGSSAALQNVAFSMKLTRL